MTRIQDLEAIAIQAVAEVGQGLKLAEEEAKHGQLRSCRETLRVTRRALAVLDEAIPALMREYSS